MPSKRHQTRFNNAKTPKTAAKAFHAWLLEFGRDVWGCEDASGIVYYPPGEGWDTRDNPGVGWDGGPYEGLSALTMGESILAPEMGYGKATPEFDLNSNPHVFVEPYNHWLLGFYPA